MTIDRSKIFRHPNGGARYLKGLFWETTPSDKSSVLYTLKDSDHQGYPSLYRLYMEIEDQTEYEFASAYLDGYEHWQMLCKCNWFKPYIQRWRNELELKLRARYLAKLMADAEDPTSKTQLISAKYIIEKGWEPKTAGKRGRPTKDEISTEAERIAMTELRIQEDFERLQSELNKEDLN